MDEDQLYVREPSYAPPRRVLETVSIEWLAMHLAQLRTRKEMYRAILLGVTTGACLVQSLAWLFH
jgi:hypothetical protein